jgi:uncharacterized protein involved in cysteine biosynthesis
MKLLFNQKVKRKHNVFIYKHVVIEAVVVVLIVVVVLVLVVVWLIVSDILKSISMLLNEILSTSNDNRK